MKAGRRRIHEDEAKVLYEGSDPNTLVQYFKDQTLAQVAGVAGRVALPVEGKGVLSNRISACLMEHLNAAGVPTHFIRRLNMREQLVRNSERLPFWLRIHNYATAGFAETFGLESGTALPRAIVEYYLRPTAEANSTAKAEVHSALISDEHITAFNWATTWEMDEIFHLALRINDFLSGFCLGAGLRLSRVDLSFGRLWEEDHTAIVLVDEITPDSCRLWDLRSNRPLLPELPDTPAAVGSVSSHQGGKVVELATSSKAPPTGTAESRNSNTARLYQHLYREVAQRFGVLTDAETLAHDDSETLFPMAREEAGQNAESTQEAKSDTGGVVLPMRRDLRRLSPRLRRSRKAEDSPEGEPS